MKYDILRVGAATPDIRLADPAYNANKITELIGEASEKGVRVLVFPELCITGSTCGELFFQDRLLKNARAALQQITEFTINKKILVTVGLPYAKDEKVYNVTAVIADGNILGLVPKKNVLQGPGAEYFEPAGSDVSYIETEDDDIPFGTDLLFVCSDMQSLKLAVEPGEDILLPVPVSVNHTLAGATLILNPCAEPATVGSRERINACLAARSQASHAAYIHANAGFGESTTDNAFDGRNVIAEDGRIKCESEPFSPGLLFTETDLGICLADRRKDKAFRVDSSEYEICVFGYEEDENDLPQVSLTNRPEKLPFIPSDPQKLAIRAKEIIDIQVAGLVRRMTHIGCKNAVIGVSGGLDSTLALIVIVEAFKRMGLPKDGIHAVTMPCFGTSGRTYKNSLKLIEKSGAKAYEINIKDAVTLHFKDIGQDPENHDVTFENSQARERTQVLMDLANKVNGLVVGTGDLSELALGWATYNGDHMSMYGVNADVPKTLVRLLVSCYAETCGDRELADLLIDIVNTPVSPELLPPKAGEISQKTEESVGPYELNDFFLYYFLKYGYDAEKVFYLACEAFAGEYNAETVRKWLNLFIKRFFNAQFKRSCLPDGAAIGSISLSPRAGFKMPSDAVYGGFQL